MQRPDQPARAREMGVLSRRNLERVEHPGGVVRPVGHTARLAVVEAPRAARGRAQVQRDQGVDLTRVPDRRDRPEHPIGLIHAGAVVRLDPREIELDHSRRGDLPPQDG